MSNITEDTVEEQANRLIMSCGVTPNYIGFKQTVCAVCIDVKNPDALTLVSKQIYAAVAQYYGTSWKAVERNLRTIVTIAWETNPLSICQIAGYALNTKPTVSQFLSIITNYLLHNTG